MHIGILTFHKAINYGAYLQSFSLTKKIQEQFPHAEVEIVDYIAPKERFRKLYMVLWNMKHHGLKGSLAEIKRIFVFRSMQKHLPLSPKSFCTNNLKKLYSYIDERYDILIIGSDAVFNWNQTKFPSAFIPDYPFSIPVYTYAASVHGLRFFSAEQEILQACGRSFCRMKVVGVRDRCTEQFVKLCSEGTNIIHCCDPTLFIDKETIYQRGSSIQNKLQKKNSFSLTEKYIVVMAPDSPMIQAMYQKYRNEYKFVSVFVKSCSSDYYLSDLNPFEWTVILKHASMVITSYFHGTLLSLVQGTPAIVLDYSGYCDDQYEGKLKDLMVTRFDLGEFYFDKTFVESLSNQDTFYRIADSLLRGEHDKRICTAIENEQHTVLPFLKILKSMDTAPPTSFEEV